MELRMVREQVAGSPPPAPHGTTVREWFAGLAMMNPTLMKDISPDRYADEAVRLADELIKALVAPRVPTLESMRAPSDEEMVVWEQKVDDDKVKSERMSRVTTCPGIRRVTPPSSAKGKVPSRKPTMKFNGVLPPPLTVPPTPQQVISSRPKLGVEGRYLFKGEELVEVDVRTVRPGALGKNR